VFELIKGETAPGANLTGFSVDEYNDFIDQSFGPFSDDLPAQVLALYNISTKYQNNAQLAYEVEGVDY